MRETLSPEPYRKGGRHSLHARRTLARGCAMWIMRRERIRKRPVPAETRSDVHCEQDAWPAAPRPQLRAAGYVDRGALLCCLIPTKFTIPISFRVMAGHSDDAALSTVRTCSGSAASVPSPERMYNGGAVTGGSLIQVRAPCILKQR